MKRNRASQIEDILARVLWALSALLALGGCGGSSQPARPAPELLVTHAFAGYFGVCSAPSFGGSETVFLLCNEQYGDLFGFSTRSGDAFGQRIGRVQESFYGLGWSNRYTPSVFFSSDLQVARVVTTGMGESQRDAVLWGYTRDPETGWLERPSPNWSNNSTKYPPTSEGLAMSSDGRFFLWVAETREGDFIQAFGKEVLDRPGFTGGSDAVVTFAANSSDAYIAPSADDAHLFRWSLERDEGQAHGPRVPVSLPEVGRLASNAAGTLLFAGSDWHPQEGLAIEVLQRDSLTGELTPGFARLAVTRELCPECLDPQARLEWLAVDSRGDVYAATAVPYDLENENPRSFTTALFRWRRSGESWELDIARVDLGWDADPSFQVLTFSLGERPGELLATTRPGRNAGGFSQRALGPFSRIRIVDDRDE